MNIIFHNEAIRWEISKYAKVVGAFLPDLAVSEILTFHIFYLQIAGQGHGAQFSQ